MAEKNISVNGMECIHSIFGNFDENINIIQREYNVSVYSRNGEIIINGAEANVDAAAAVIDSLEKMFNKGEVINDQSVR
ncbi:MAG: phosphate starvation-inducible protein PhoH, partial [Ruminiclostridium sp.]|nr:phosphate starvation-inducible protein PhoH [Ruminiclostridium sp.]